MTLLKFFYYKSHNYINEYTRLLTLPEFLQKAIQESPEKLNKTLAGLLSQFLNDDNGIEKEVKYSFCQRIISDCFAEKITVAYGDTLAPWVMAETDSGILVDLVAAALTPLGYEIENVYYPYARRIESYKTHLVDVVCDINPVNIQHSGLKGHFLR